MSVHTTSQRMAREAYARIAAKKPSHEYVSFAREFPTLVHSCGLAQAVAFALAKRRHQAEYVDDLAAVLRKAGHGQIGNGQALLQETNRLAVTQYMRLSRNALAAAVWLKRYAEAEAED